jgi:hypothetical protein
MVASPPGCRPSLLHFCRFLGAFGHVPDREPDRRPWQWDCRKGVLRLRP